MSGEHTLSRLEDVVEGGGPDAVRAGSNGTARGGGNGTIGDLETVHGADVQEISETWRVGHLVAGRFRLSHCIGQGGMGKVFLARDEILGRAIALKRVPQEIIFDSDARDDLRQEANRLLDLAHENVIRVHTYYDEPDWPFFAMEYLEGPTLKQLVNARKKNGRQPIFSLEELSVVTRQVGRGLEYAHGKNLIHRDLKPANLMLVSTPGETLGEADTIKITDFGISRVIADSTLRQTGKRSGTLPYMSPEQFRGEECTVESDIYSLAATYYELLSGRPPFYTGDIGYQILNVTPKPVPNVPVSVNAAILRALSKNPKHRYESAQQFTEALEQRRRFPDLVTLSLLLRRTVTRIAAGLLLLLLVVFAALGVRSFFAGGAIVTIGRESPSVTVEKHEFATVLQAQLDGEVPVMTKKTSLPIRLRLEKELLRSPDLFAGIHLILDPDFDARVVRGELSPAGDVLDFRLDQLAEGTHVVRVGLEPSARELVALSDRLHIERSFTVDLTGPDFTIEPYRRESFVDVADEPLRGDAVLVNTLQFSTFRDQCTFQLVASSPADIAAAYYQVVTRGRDGELQQGAEFEIDNPLQWTATLARGPNLFLVFAEDHLGNRSEKKKVSVTRLHLDVSPFELDRQSSQGNRVTVEGTVVVEGPMFPKLAFFVNENQIQDAEHEFGQPTRDFPHFRTTVRLPRFSNSVEVRYEWGKEIFPFSPPKVLTSVEVAAPEIVLDPRPPGRTSQTSVVLSGSVTPYFEGLTVTLDQKGGSIRTIALKPETAGRRATATFQETVLLSPNKTNQIELRSHYDGRTLGEVPQAAAIYCDTTPPDVLEFGFGQSGAFLHVRVTPLEELAQLRIRQGDNGPWQLLVVEPEGYYLHIVDLPARKTSFSVEMTDLVGNVNAVTRDCDVFEADGSFAIGGPEEEARPLPGSVRDSDVDVQRATSAKLLLEELGIEFTGYGSRGEEMSATEIPERAWFAYLVERRHRDVERGSRTSPAIVGTDFGEELVLGFVEWLEEQLDDGYDYYVPTPGQWRAAFLGSRDPADATRDIQGWFQGTYPGWRFDPRPEVRYGINRVLSIGSRRKNQTVTGLLDMESNLQEIVRSEDGTWYVIGGWNTQREYELRDSCLAERPLKSSLEDFRRKFTGLRIGRRPRS